MPSFIADDAAKEKFDDEAYVREIEHLFIDRFTQNLEVKPISSPPFLLFL